MTVQGQPKKSLKEIIAEEYRKCAMDPVHFMKKYCIIQHPQRGKIPFHLYPFQADCLVDFKDNRFNIILKSRQLGISTLSAGHILHKMLFNEDFNALVIATKVTVAKNLVEKVRVMHDLLPIWLRDGGNAAVEDNKLSLKLKNGSLVKAITSSPDAGRSEALSLLVVDEAAFIRNIDDIWLSAQSTLSTGGSAIVLSTPNGVGNWFHQMWVGAADGSNGFKTNRLHWTVHPERNQSWRDEQTRILGVKGSAQECDCLWGSSIVNVKDIITGEIFDISLEDLYGYDTMDNYIIKKNTKYEIMTPSGFQSFGGVRSLQKDVIYNLSLSNGKTIKSSESHPFIIGGSSVNANNLNIGDWLDSADTKKIYITNIVIEQFPIELYDIVGVANGNIFNVDGIVSHNCDFVSSGDTVIDPQLLLWYKETYVMDPIEKRGFDGNLWVWEHPNYNRQYMVVADVARGDASDYSTAQVIDIEDSSQVAEYKGRLDTKDFGNFLVGLATEYNNALLVIENSNVGWATIQQVINRGYGNLFYMSKDLQYIDVEKQMTNKYYREERQMVAGFSTTSRTRPLIISTLDQYMNDKDIIIRSVRLIDELFTFIWNSGRAEGMKGYNDDLTMALAIGLWVRNTALRLRQEGVDLTKAMLNASTIQNSEGLYTNNWQNGKNPFEMTLARGEVENLTWLLR